MSIFEAKTFVIFCFFLLCLQQSLICHDFDQIYRFIAKTEVVIGRSQPEPRSGEGCDQADHGRPVEAMKVFLATVSPTNGRGPRCTETDQAGIEAPFLSLQLDDPLEEEDKV